MKTLDDFFPPAQARWLEQLTALVVHDVIIQKTFGGDVTAARHWLEQNTTLLATMIAKHAVPKLNESNRNRRRDLFADLMKLLETDPRARANLAHVIGASAGRR
jgi:hypothetical protein